MPCELFKYTQRILEILQKDEEAQGNDVVLYALLIQGPPFYFNLDTTTARELLTKIYTGSLPHLESVRRTRQALQRKYPSLQGKKRRTRKQLELEWKDRILKKKITTSGDLT